MASNYWFLELNDSYSFACLNIFGFLLGCVPGDFTRTEEVVEVIFSANPGGCFLGLYEGEVFLSERISVEGGLLLTVDRFIGWKNPIELDLNLEEATTYFYPLGVVVEGYFLGFSGERFIV